MSCAEFSTQRTCKTNGIERPSNVETIIIMNQRNNIEGKKAHTVVDKSLDCYGTAGKRKIYYNKNGNSPVSTL